MVLEWVVVAEGMEAARRLYRRLLALPGPPLELFQAALALERAAAAAVAADKGEPLDLTVGPVT